MSGRCFPNRGAEETIRGRCFRAREVATQLSITCVQVLGVCPDNKPFAELGRDADSISRISMRIVQREQWIIEKCIGKSVLHLGCTDSPMTAEKLAAGEAPSPEAARSIEASCRSGYRPGGSYPYAKTGKDPGLIRSQIGRASCRERV